MKRLNRMEILDQTRRKIEAVNVPDWNGSVCIRSLTAAERDEWEASLIGKKGKNRDLNLKNARAALVALCACNDEGELLFVEEDVVRLGNLHARPVDQVYEKCALMNGITKEDLEELGKPSAATPASGPSSPSPKGSGTPTLT